ncbi:molybdate transport permease protein [Marinomonas sp. MED121]|uniref:molybdate ABC transporter permease subunit n=1 Tax=Marinomonas sp. MED121 TaxID=314277 RepID=UPI000068FA59|nr:molybdate ABC transporter permease subunit [Marinomonas sp. MED121]EAQ64133.1 molybdate transport permease protein [Marinomonas sp. MED121]
MLEFIQGFQLSEFEITALILSLKVSGVASLCVLPLAIFIGYLLSRTSFWGKSLFEAIVYLPLVLPPVVIGYLLLMSFSTQSILGRFLLDNFGFQFAFKWQGAALAVAVVALPLMVRSIRLAFDLIDLKIEQAALTLGASPLRVFLTISLPLALPGIISGAILGLARGLGEFGATITFAANIPGQTQTLPLAMYRFIQTPGAELMAARLCIIAIIIAIIALVLSELLTRKMKNKLAGVK